MNDEVWRREKGRGKMEEGMLSVAKRVAPNEPRPSGTQKSRLGRPPSLDTRGNSPIHCVRTPSFSFQSQTAVFHKHLFSLGRGGVHCYWETYANQLIGIRTKNYDRRLRSDLPLPASRRLMVRGPRRTPPPQNPRQRSRVRHQRPRTPQKASMACQQLECRTGLDCPELTRIDPAIQSRMKSLATGMVTLYPAERAYSEHVPRTSRFRLLWGR